MIFDKTCGKKTLIQQIHLMKIKKILLLLLEILE